MGLRLICGRAGTGKSHYCFWKIKENLTKEKKIYMITPEQFSFTAEKKLLETISSNSVIHAEVLTFARMAHRVANTVGGVTKVNLDKAGKAMLFYDILSEKKKSLKFLGKTKQNIEVIEKQMTEFKKHGITIEMLKNTLEETKDPYLKTKLQDMLTVYEAFEQKIEEQYIDENDRLTMLAKQLPQTDMFHDAVFYIDEFTGFTQQEYDIIAVLLSQAKQVNITISTEDLDVLTKQDTDVFYANKKTATRLLEIAKSNGVTIEKTVFLKENYRFKNDDLKHLEQNSFQVPYQIYKKEVEGIHLFLATNAYSEIEQVAKQITDLVRNQHYRYQDIAIITKDLETYAHLCKVIFENYQIPVFIDEKKTLSQNHFVKYLLAVLEVLSKNWSYEAVFQYLKTGYIEIEEECLYDLENYCIQWGIRGNKWYEKDWHFGEESPKEIEKVEQLNRQRQKIVQPLIALKENLIGNKTVEQITEKLYAFFIENGIDKKIQNRIQILQEQNKLQLAKEQQLAWNSVMQVLEEMWMVFGKETVSFDRYAELLKIGLENHGLGEIPATNDQVMMGDIDRTRSHKIKAMFIIGMNDGVFPSVYKEEGFFNDKDRQVLQKQGVELAKGTIDRLYEDNFSIYKAFTTAENNLYLSYPSSNLEGGALRASILISKIKKIYPKLQEKSDILQREARILNEKTTFEELIYQLQKQKSGQKIDPIWYQVYYYYQNNPHFKISLEGILKALSYSNLPQTITKENMERLYGDTLQTSVSRLEQYCSCPYSYYLKYGLKLTEQSQFVMQAIDTGTFMHEVIDRFFHLVRERQLEVKQLEESQIYSLVQEVIEEKLAMPKNYIFTSTPKYKALTNRLKKVVTTSMKYILESLKNSDFEVFGNELEFKKGKAYEPIILEIEDGKKVEITGKIDRVDMAKTPDGTYIRIIDYKSSVKSMDLNNVIAGLQIQLLTYLDATCKIEEVMPAGVLYFSLIDPLIKTQKAMSQEEMEEELKKKFKMQGLILADVKVIRMMDKTLDTGSSNTIPVYIDKEGKVSNGKSNVVTKEQFKDLQKYTNHLIGQIAKSIFDGNIAIEPYYHIKDKKTPCEYCSYHSICQFQAGKCGNHYHYISNLEKQVLLDKIREKEE